MFQCESIKGWFKLVPDNHVISDAFDNSNSFNLAPAASHTEFIVESNFVIRYYPMSGILELWNKD